LRFGKGKGNEVFIRRNSKSNRKRRSKMKIMSEKEVEKFEKYLCYVISLLEE
jgi:hypothetical protein